MIEEKPVRMTLHVQCLLNVFLPDPTGQHYGLELALQAGVPIGSIYPILARLETAGWLTSAWEDIDEAKEGRRARRYYSLTGVGHRLASEQLRLTRQRLLPSVMGSRADGTAHRRRSGRLLQLQVASSVSHG